MPEPIVEKLVCVGGRLDGYETTATGTPPEHWQIGLLMPPGRVNYSYRFVRTERPEYELIRHIYAPED